MNTGFYDNLHSMMWHFCIQRFYTVFWSFTRPIKHSIAKTNEPYDHTTLNLWFCDYNMPDVFGIQSLESKLYSLGIFNDKQSSPGMCNWGVKKKK